MGILEGEIKKEIIKVQKRYQWDKEGVRDTE